MGMGRFSRVPFFIRIYIFITKIVRNIPHYFCAITVMKFIRWQCILAVLRLPSEPPSESSALEFRQRMLP